MGQMDMNESPHVVLVVRSGGTTSRVLSAHEDEIAAARWIGDEALAGRLPAGGTLALQRCPAPFLAQRTADARSIARQDRPLDRGPYVLADLRDILRLAPALADDPSAAERMPPSALLDLVRALVEAARTPASNHRERLERIVGDDPDRVQLDDEGLDRAARMVRSMESEMSWENSDRHHQERCMREAGVIVRAYLTDPADGED